MTDYDTILVEQRGAVTLVTLNRPHALNALNSEVLKELIDAFAACARDDIQLVVLCHDGEALPDDRRITALPYEEVPRPAPGPRRG